MPRVFFNSPALSSDNGAMSKTEVRSATVRLNSIASTHTSSSHSPILSITLKPCCHNLLQCFSFHQRQRMTFSSCWSCLFTFSTPPSRASCPTPPPYGTLQLPCAPLEASPSEGCMLDSKATARSTHADTFPMMSMMPNNDFSPLPAQGVRLRLPHSHSALLREPGPPA